MPELNNQNIAELRENLLKICHKYEDPEFMRVHGKCDMELAAPRCAKRVKELEKLFIQHSAAIVREARIEGLTMAHYCVDDGSPEERRINKAIETLKVEAALEHPHKEEQS
jgi:hypothetical protein